MTKWTVSRNADNQVQLDLSGDSDTMRLAMHDAIRRTEGLMPRPSGSLLRVGTWTGDFKFPDGTPFNVVAVAGSGGNMSIVCNSGSRSVDEAVVRRWVESVNDASVEPPRTKPVTKPEPTTPDSEQSGLVPMATYMIRGFHDWTFDENPCLKGRYYLEPGFRRLIGQAERVISVHYANLRDDWEDDFRRALDAWGELGFRFREIDNPETAEVVVDDEKDGAFAIRRFRFANRKHGDLWVMETEGREINVSKEWPEHDTYDAMLHEIGHVLGLGHPGPYDGTRPDSPMFTEDTSTNTIMSYFGPSTGKLGPADRLAIEMLYGSATPVTEESATRLVSVDIGGGRFGFTSKKLPQWGVTIVGGDLTDAAENGIVALFESAPGNPGIGWLVTDRLVDRPVIGINGRDASFMYASTSGNHHLYRAERGIVSWPSRPDRALGIDIELGDGWNA